MSWTARQLAIADLLEAEVLRLVRAGEDDMGILAGMTPHMPDFKRLLDDAQAIGEICSSGCYPGLLRYSRILETLAREMAAGRIKVP
ncbi:MAG: arylsulfatase regulator [Candidatus Eisenbacteria bacterium]|nr:arylsulfatase regulator [Candidatus Eisenbacteria bacterium]